MTIPGGDKGRDAFNAFLPRMQALDEEEFVAIRTDVGLAATGVLGIAKKLRKDVELYARFVSLPAAEFDRAHLDELEQLAWAAIHTHEASAKAREQRSRVTLPAELVERGIDIEERMQRCCEYHLEDHPIAGDKVKELRPGTGHRDLANDLRGYAALYREYPDEVRFDRKNYRPTDAEEAVAISEQITELIGAGWSNEDQIALDHHSRAWTLLHRSYNEVRTTGHWLLRAEPVRANKLLPALNPLGHRPASRRAEQPDADAPETPAPETPAPETPAQG